MEYIHMTGGESVERAAASMRDSANQMTNAASQLEHVIGFQFQRALEDHQAFMNDWLERFAAVVSRASEGSPS